jgi:hypothetical protein
MANKTLNDSAKIVMQAEQTALIEIKEALDILEASFQATYDKLDFPEGYISASKQIITETRSTLAYRYQQLATMILPTA